MPDWRDKERIAALDLPPHFARWDETTRPFADLLTASWYWAAIEWFDEHEWAGVDPCPSRSLVRAPTLIVTGERDVTFGAECAGQLASMCTRATVGVIPGAGHFTWVEEPDAYRQLVGDFVHSNLRGVARVGGSDITPVPPSDRFGGLPPAMDSSLKN